MAATIAAVTLCAPILLIIMSVACIFGMGGSSVIARLLGEDKKEESGATLYYVLCMIREAARGNQLVPWKPSRFSPNASMVRGVISIGIPGALITVLMSVSNIVLNNYIGIYGSDAVASYGIAYKLDMVPILLSVGLSQGVAPLVGYYYGAGRTKRMSDTVKHAALYGVLMGAVFTVVFVLFGKPLASVFLQDSALIRQTGYFLTILCLSAPLLGIINMMTSYFQALGKAVKSLTITVLRNAVLFIPGVILLNRFWQLNGVIAAQPVVEAVLTIICVFMYLKDAKTVGKND